MTLRLDDVKELAGFLKERPDLAKANKPVPDATGLDSTRLKAKTGSADRVQSKYRSQRTNGYASKKEAEFAQQLGLRQKAGEVWFWLEQVKFKLPGGTSHRVDFMVFYPDGTWRLIEIKGRDLPMGKMKRKMVEEIYGVSITLT